MSNENKMVTLVSTSNSTVVVNRPEYGIRRLWAAKGMAQQIPFEIVQNLLFTNGFRNLIEEGVLYIPDMKTKIELGLEDEGTVQPTKIIILNDTQMMTLLKVRTYEQFVQELSHLPMSQANALVDFAVKNQIIDTKKVNYLKELTGRDIVKLIAREAEIREIDARNAAIEKQHKMEEGRRV